VSGWKNINGELYLQLDEKSVYGHCPKRQIHEKYKLAKVCLALPGREN
jgi:hypothetical protein